MYDDVVNCWSPIIVLVTVAHRRGDSGLASVLITARSTTRYSRTDCGCDVTASWHRWLATGCRPALPSGFFVLCRTWLSLAGSARPAALSGFYVLMFVPAPPFIFRICAIVANGKLLNKVISKRCARRPFSRSSGSTLSGAANF